MTARSNDEKKAPCPCGSGLPYRRCCELLVLGHEAGPAVTLPLLDPPGEPDEDEDFELASPEVRDAYDALWEAFEALPQPSVAQMDEYLERLLALPHELTSWGDVLRDFESRGHPDIRGVYRRIAAEVRATRTTELAFFHWAAAELFSNPELRDLLPEVASGFARLDAQTYDADALAHILDHVLSARFDAETLALAERYLPITRAGVEEGALMPYVMPLCGSLIFQLRAGLALRASAGRASIAELAAELQQDIEDEVDLEAAEHAARVICESSRPPVWTREDFRLPGGDISESDSAWATSLALYDSLMRVAREAWHEEQIPPGYGFRGLCRVLESVHDARDGEDKPLDTLLDYLDVPGLEERVARSCADILGTNESQARMVLDAYGLLLRFTARHGLIPPGQVQRVRVELARLAAVVEV